MERAVRYLVRRHRSADASEDDRKFKEARAQQIRTIKASVAKVKGFLKDREDRRGSSGKVVQSNITDGLDGRIHVDTMGTYIRFFRRRNSSIGLTPCGIGEDKHGLRLGFGWLRQAISATGSPSVDKYPR
jgi:hypothetical protein